MNILQEFDTITAIATPLGTGGVGIIRISGSKSFPIAEMIFKGDIEIGKICYGKIVDDNDVLDEVIVLPFKAPHSYTGEDVIEIHCHGGVNVVKNILNLVIKSGARMAERGEFTKRAFLNKKMDLSQAEAVADIIHSKTAKFATQSVKNLSGSLKNNILKIRNDIFELLSKIVAGIDFPEDVKEPEYDYLISEITKIIEKIENVLKNADASNVMRLGIKVAIIGRPNAGKSSLFNALLNLERAIVTDIAGTTRDVLRENLDWDVPVTLIDTAGIRDTENKIEKIGIEYSKQAVDEADFVIFIYDAHEGFTHEDKAIYELIKDKPYLIAGNKIDLGKNAGLLDETVEISTVTGQGLELLKSKLKNYTENYNCEDMEFTTNVRQQNCLKNSLVALNNALAASKEQQIQDLISIDLKSALLALDELTGEVITDDILNNIFDNFCIGK
ncbi:tRNA uridine-5-carboxymethylaminomethyl(34) synthesis GTPase MnmE [bacterium]|nr:tRNA uridine-5-carboxymethylaminomethyl(34) synthesis GTPase MnmE [bacterium]